MDVPIAANVLGTLGAVFWSIQLIPQIVVNYRRHNATGLQPSMVSILVDYRLTIQMLTLNVDDALGMGWRTARSIHHC